MLPQVINEQQVFIFKFWFADKVQDGMHFQNELFCQISTFTAEQRSRIYQTSCKLAQKGVTLVITVSPTTYRLWGSLRDEAVKESLTDPSSSQLLSILGLERSTEVPLLQDQKGMLQ